MPAKKKESFVCICNKNVTKTHSSVGCYICGRFFHINCVNVTADQHKLFCQNRKVFHYICDCCSASPKDKCPTNLSLSAGDIQQELHNISMDIGIQFEEHNRIFEKQVYASIVALEHKMIELFDKFRAEQQAKINKLTNERFMDNVITRDSAPINKRLEDLELSNRILQRRLNRADIIVKGLPRNIKNLSDPIFKIAAICGLSISHSGLQHCAYINNGRAVLVKLNSVQQRDQIIMNFSKKRFLLLKDVIGGDIASKIFLSDHLTPGASKLLSVCRDLRTENKILKYKFLNMDVPKVRVVFPDNKQKVLNTEQCVAMLDDDLNVNGCAYGNQNDVMFNAVNNVAVSPSVNLNISSAAGSLSPVDGVFLDDNLAPS